MFQRYINAPLSRKQQGVVLRRVKTNARIDDLGDSLRGEIQTNTNRIMNAIDAFAGKSQSQDRAPAAHAFPKGRRGRSASGLDRAVILHGRALTDVQAGMKDHEKRIKNLESRR